MIGRFVFNPCSHGVYKMDCIKVNELISELQNRFQQWEYAVRHAANTAIKEAYDLGLKVGEEKGRSDVYSEQDWTPGYGPKDGY